MKKVFKWKEDAFVDWIVQDYDTDELLELGEDRVDFAYSVAGMFPIDFIANYDEIKNDPQIKDCVDPSGDYLAELPDRKHWEIVCEN